MSSVWPTTLAGWLSLALAGLAFVGGIYGYAKHLVNLNGLGERVKKIEEAQAAAKEHQTTGDAEVVEYRRDVLELVERMSRIEKGMEGVEKSVIEEARLTRLEVKEIERAVFDINLAVSQRLVRTETQLEALKKNP